MITFNLIIYSFVITIIYFIDRSSIYQTFYSKIILIIPLHLNLSSTVMLAH